MVDLRWFHVTTADHGPLCSWGWPAVSTSWVLGWQHAPAHPCSVLLEKNSGSVYTRQALYQWSYNGVTISIYYCFKIKIKVMTTPPPLLLISDTLLYTLKFWESQLNATWSNGTHFLLCILKHLTSNGLHSSPNWAPENRFKKASNQYPKEWETRGQSRSIGLAEEITVCGRYFSF